MYLDIHCKLKPCVDRSIPSPVGLIALSSTDSCSSATLVFNCP